MKTNNESTGNKVVRPERRRGSAAQIAMARARRKTALLTSDDFMDEIAPEATPKVSDPSYQDFRQELRRIIAEDAEAAAANEQTEPDAIVPPRKRSRTKIGLIGLGCVLGIGAAAYSLANAN